MTEHKYHDTDGNPCSLSTLCRREPEWAHSRITTLTAERDAAQTELAVALVVLAEYNAICACGCEDAAHECYGEDGERRCRRPRGNRMMVMVSNPRHPRRTEERQEAMTTAHDKLRLDRGYIDCDAVVDEYDRLQNSNCILQNEFDALTAEHNHLHAEVDLAYDQRRRALSELDAALVQFAADHAIAEAARKWGAAVGLSDNDNGVVYRARLALLVALGMRPKP